MIAKVFLLLNPIKVSAAQSKGAESPFLPCWPHASWCSPAFGCLLGCMRLLQAPDWWEIQQHPQSFFFRAVLKSLCTQPGFVPGVSLTQMQTFWSLLLEFMPASTPMKSKKHRTPTLKYDLSQAMLVPIFRNSTSLFFPQGFKWKMENRVRQNHCSYSFLGYIFSLHQ